MDIAARMTGASAQLHRLTASRLLPAIRIVLWGLVALVLAVRALAPAGYMPIASEHGIRLVVCGGSQPIDWNLPQPEDSNEYTSSGTACPFVLSPFQGDAPAPPLLPAPAVGSPAEPPLARPLTVSKPPSFSPATPATGPPQFA